MAIVVVGVGIMHVFNIVMFAKLRGRARTEGALPPPRLNTAL